MTSRFTRLGFTIFSLVWLVSAEQVQAAKFGELLEALTRAGRRVDDLPPAGPIFKRADDLPANWAGKLPASNESELLRRFDRLEGVNDGLRRQFQTLSPAHRAAVIELGEASQRIIRKYDNADDLLRKLDVDGLAQMRTYGDFVVDGVQVMGPEYKTVVRKMGAGAGDFFTRYITPHKAKWLAAGAAAAYMANPEFWHDALGNLTEYGIRHLTQLGIEAGASVSRGFWNGIREKFIDDPVFSTLGVLLIVVCGALLVPRMRWFLGKHLGRWWHPPQGAVRSGSSTSAPGSDVSKSMSSPRPPRFEE